jgi:archaetidylinositol phosphate synthase
MIGSSWSHRAARVAVRPLLGTWVRPNHLTMLRLLSGLAACVCFALGTRSGLVWGGWIWLLSAFLDRADGELARIGNMMSPAGHRFDYYADNCVNAAVFVAIGIGLRDSWLDSIAVPLGALSGTSMFLIGVFAYELESRSPPGRKAYTGRWGFDPDDGMYLMAPFAWLGWFAPILGGATVGTTLMMIITGARLLKARRTAGRSPAPDAGAA